MPSIKALIRNECSAQNAMHNGMTSQDAGHVILNLFNLWEPCIELTFESLESQAKQDHSTPHRVRNRRACTCKSLFFTLLLDGAPCFSISSPQPWPWGGRSGFGRRAGDQLHPSLLVLPKSVELCSSCSQDWQDVFHTHHRVSGFVFHKSLESHETPCIFQCWSPGNRRVWISMDLFTLEEPWSALAWINSHPGICSDWEVTEWSAEMQQWSLTLFWPEPQVEALARNVSHR